MNKIISIILLISLISSLLISCNNGGNDQTPISTTEPPISTTEPPKYVPDIDYTTWVVDGYEKVLQNAEKPSDATTTIDLQMAKNEKQGFHIIVNPSSDVEGMKINVVDGGRTDIGIEIFDEYYINTGGKYYPDPIVPVDNTFSLTANQNNPILVRFNTEADTEAGTYCYKLNMIDSYGNVVQEYVVNLTVWDFALSETFSTETAAYLSYYYINLIENIPEDLYTQYYISYYEMLLDYGLCSYDLPYDILDDRADAYMSDPRVKTFKVSHEASDETIIKYYEKLKNNPDWLEKAYFYPFDEPTSIEHLETIATLCERLKTLAPEIDIVIPFFKNIKFDNKTDEIDFLDQYLGIWCAKSAAWKKGWIGDPLYKGYFGDRMEAQKAEGDKIWWYVCWEPGAPYCNLYVNETGLDHVKLFWQQYKSNVDGFLYWCTNWWMYVEDPWSDMATVKNLSPDIYGDGSLLYPGKNVGIEGPVASLRMECIRSGLEDIEILKIAEELLGRDWVDDQVSEVSFSLTIHTKENDVYNSVRKAIGEAIEKALKNK